MDMLLLGVVYQYEEYMYSVSMALIEVLQLVRTSTYRTTTTVALPML